MKFYHLDTGYCSAHDTLEGLFEMICESYCECGEGYDVYDEKDGKMKCLNCWRLNNMDKISEKEMRDEIEWHGYVIEEE